MAVACSAAPAIQPHVVARDVAWQEVSRSGLSSSEDVVAASQWPGPKKYLKPSGNAIGLHADRRGNLILAQAAMGGGRAIVRRHLKARSTVVVVDSHQGKRLNGPNDVTSDARGRIYFTDARYFGDENRVGVAGC